ncbi:hypothetical protein [Neolewinella agarilytica]|uniref:hypothetical protein n=1 Tax=Neolewinella agarilytica TaxID=478744 RepID=UPI002353DD89|nr:hypothetical protein [Neolewinella agarilytica]
MRHIVLFALLAFSVGLSAQSFKSRIHYKVNMGDSSQLHQLILLDYTKLLGTAMEVEKDSIYFLVRGTNEPTAIPLRELRFLGVFNSVESRPYRDTRGVPGFSDLTYERTALPHHSKGQIRVINLLYSVAEWNLNKNLRLGVGLAGPLGIMTTQKYRFSITPDLHLGVSSQILFLPLIERFPNNGPVVLGDVSAMLTVGNDRRFANFGTGILFNNDDPGSPIWGHRFGIGGRISPRWHVYSEMLMTLNDEFSELSLFPSINASLGAKKHRWHFGIFTVFFDEDNFFPPPLPYVGYSYYW